MKPRLSSPGKFLVAPISILLLGPFAWAGTENVLHTFTVSDGVYPYDGVIFDGSGNLYGTAFYGGSTHCSGAGCGVVFKLAPASGGGWTESTIYTFTGAADGSHPYSPLIFDAAGNLYGSTFGAYSGGGTGFGTVFKLTPNAGGTWGFSLLHTFAGGKDGAQPSGPMALDTVGNLYGTTFTGGSYNAGTAFELTPATGGHWKETVLHTFTGGKDGYGPTDILLDQKGNLYGSTPYGTDGSALCGTQSCGVVFELLPNSTGWTETVLHRFSPGSDGQYPGRLVVDSSGNLYGTASAGGNSPYCFGGCGLVFKLTPASGAIWKETVLHSFNGGGGLGPESLVFGAGGNLHGAAFSGGLGMGLIFDLASADNWAESVLYEFLGGFDGGEPVGPLVSDQADNLYGTAVFGGSGSVGVVFEVTP